MISLTNSKGISASIRRTILAFGREENYRSFGLPLDIRMRIAIRMLDRLPNSLTLCEIGCHSGEQTRVVIDQAMKAGIAINQMTLIEPSKGVLAALAPATNSIQVRLLEGTLEERIVEMPRNYFDLIYAIGSMEYVDNFQLYVEELILRLRQGGKIFFTMNAVPFFRRILLLSSSLAALAISFTIGLDVVSGLGVALFVPFLTLYLVLCLRTRRRLSPYNFSIGVIHSLIFSTRSYSKLSRKKAEWLATQLGERVYGIEDAIFPLWLFEITKR